MTIHGCPPKRNTLGGVYGSGPDAPSAPVDNVSYWDGDGIDGKPAVKISLGQQRAYFYKSGQLVGISQLSTGREGLNTPMGQYRIIQKDVDHVSTMYGDYVDASDQVIVPNVESGKDPKPPGTHFKGAPMPYFMRIVGGVGMHAGYLPGVLRRTAVFACRSSWRKAFSIGLNRNPGYDHELANGPRPYRSRLAFESARPQSRLSLCWAMIIITQPTATEEQIERIVARVREFGLEPQINRGAARVIINVIGPEDLARESPRPLCPESRRSFRYCGRTNWRRRNFAGNHRRLRSAMFASAATRTSR